MPFFTAFCRTAAITLALIFFVAVCAVAAADPSPAHHLVVLIDGSGSMGKYPGWEVEFSRIIREGIRVVTGADNKYNKAIYRQGTDYLSVLIFGLPKKSPLSIKKDFIRRVICFQKGLDLRYELNKIRLSNSLLTNYTALIWAAPLGLHETSVCSASGSDVAVGETYLLIVTDDQANWSPGQNSEVSILRSSLANDYVVTERGEGIDYGESINNGLSQWFDFWSDKQEYALSWNHFKAILIKLHYERAESEARSLINRPPDQVFIRQGGKYTGELEISLDKDRALKSPFRALRAAVSTTLGNFNSTEKLDLKDTFLRKMRINIPASDAAVNDPGRITISYFLQLKDPFYGRQMIKLVQEVNAKIKPSPTTPVLRVNLPGFLYYIMPWANQDKLETIVQTVLFLLTVFMLYVIYRFLKRPDHKIEVYEISNKDKAASVFKVQAGQNLNSGKELLAVFKCVNLARPRLKVFKPEIAPFSLKGEVTYNLHKYIRMIGFDWRMQPCIDLKAAYQDSLYYLFFDPASIKQFPESYDGSAPKEEKIKYKVDFQVWNNNAGTYHHELELKLIPEIAKPLIKIVEMKNEIGHQTELQQLYLGALTISSSAVLAYSDPLSCRITLELKKGENSFFNALSFDKNSEEIDTKSLDKGDATSAAKHFVIAATGGQSPATLVIQGLPYGSAVNSNIYLDCSKIPAPLFEPEDYALVISYNQSEGTKTYPPKTRRLRINRDERK
ncbi:MAG: hypothetical protein PHU23_16300, partial [Dehalococcoidales bacterium]|nr:hypothetical protein [Dehalococcoidales bacterium]